jgi:hypothetical protein
VAQKQQQFEADLKRRKNVRRVLVRPKTPIEKAIEKAIALAKVAQSTSSRPRRAQALQPPRYIIGPVWGESLGAAGGVSMKVTLGPTAGQTTNYGSTPGANTPTIMATLKLNFAGYGWVAGHLLNDNLGGLGDAYNLTPLTTAGNKNHLVGCEALLKATIDKAYSHSQFNKSHPYWYGIYYEVNVSEEKHEARAPWPKNVATHLCVTAKAIKQHKETQEVTDLTNEEAPAGLYFEPMSDKRIENTLNMVV